MSKKIIVALSLLLSPSVASATITNNINVTTNTGGNTVTNETSNTIETGSTSTNISIKNNGAGSTNKINVTTDSTDSAATKINVESDGDGENQVNLKMGTQTFELTQKDGKTYVKTTDGQGKIEEREWNERDKLTISLEDDNVITVEPAGEDFTIVQNIQGTKVRVFTEYDLQVDQDSRRIVIQTPNGPQSLATPPMAVKQAVDQQVAEVTDRLMVTFENDQLVYKTTGKTSKKFLWVFPVTIEKTLTVSADGAATVSVSYQNQIQKFLDSLSN